ncbi:MAG: zinc-binding dehydrogenase [Phycisphaerales bacterium]|nr:zinc-binding dehydrogenase [Phycisphaerales bacterium]
MRAVLVERQGTPVHRNVRFADDWPEPRAAAGEAVIATEASALNHLDLWVGRGLPGVETFPRIGGSDGCGMVESIGPGVDEAWLGRRVIMNAATPLPAAAHPDARPALADISMIGEHTNGANAERFVAPVNQLLDVGNDGDPTEAAAFGLTFLTAWRCLITRAELQAGQTVLITGIGGGVALAGLAIARHFGCPVIVTSRHQWKLDKATELGAAHGVLDTGEDWSRAVRGLTGKRGVDVVLDSVGKAVHLSCIKSMARGGALVTPGCTSGPAATTDLTRIFWNQLRLLGSTMGDMDEFAQVTALFRAGALRPVIDQVFDAADAPAAYERLEAGEQFGKIVLRWS